MKGEQVSLLLCLCALTAQSLNLHSQTKQFPFKNIWTGVKEASHNVVKDASHNVVEEASHDVDDAFPAAPLESPESTEKHEKILHRIVLTAPLGEDELPKKEFEKPPTLKSKGYDFATTTETTENGCPVMPAKGSEWEGSYWWGVFIDGKDVEKGPHVYDWDSDFFKHINRCLSGIYAREPHSVGKQGLSVEMIEHFRAQTYGDVIYTPPKDLAAKGIMPECTNKMQCEDVQALLQRIPEDFYHYRNKTHEERQRVRDGCPMGLEARTAYTKDILLANLVAEYNKNINSVLSSTKLAETTPKQKPSLIGRTPEETEMKEKLLEHLVAFLRGFAFLHTFQGGNGRLRNMMLQRELRRLGLGCGTMMYNYNKDAFVDGFPRYLEKVKDGIKKFDDAYDKRINPWTMKSAVEQHERDFSAISGLEKCASNSKQFGSGGNIALHRQQQQP